MSAIKVVPRVSEVIDLYDHDDDSTVDNEEEYDEHDDEEEEEEEQEEEEEEQHKTTTTGSKRHRPKTDQAHSFIESYKLMLKVDEEIQHIQKKRKECEAMIKSHVQNDRFNRVKAFLEELEGHDKAIFNKKMEISRDTREAIHMLQGVFCEAGGQGTCPVCYNKYDGENTWPYVNTSCGHVVCGECKSERCSVCRKHGEYIRLFI